MSHAELPQPEQSQTELDTWSKDRLSSEKLEFNRLVEAGKLAPVGYELNQYLVLQELGLSLTRAELGNKAFIITKAELTELGYVEFIDKYGNLVVREAQELVGYGDDDELYIFPDDMGDPSPEQSA